MISEQEFKQASQLIGCSVSAIRAVDEVESGGAGFFASGKIKLKFEGHVFHQYTKGRFDASHPTLSYPKWTERYSQSGEAAYNRFNQAFDLDPVAAMLATSWGRYQIMGFNFSSCGLKDIHAFVTFLKVDEGNHLEAFCRYIKSQKLGFYLVHKDWDGFALHYNGPLYQRNHYSINLAKADAKYLAQTA